MLQRWREKRKAETYARIAFQPCGEKRGFVELFRGRVESIISFLEKDWGRNGLLTDSTNRAYLKILKRNVKN